MTTVMVLDDAGLTSVAHALNEASLMMTSDNTPIPNLGLPTITLVNAEIQAFAQALDIARLALADAAGTACLATLELQSRSTTLDTQLAGSVQGDFALPPVVNEVVT